MIPTIGRIVHYKLTVQDAEQIVARRRDHPGMRGNPVAVGDVYPMLITRVWNESAVNGTVFLDGYDTLWITSRMQGSQEGQWDWPPRV